MAKQDIYNPRCIINLLYWEANKKVLPCKSSPLFDRCREYQTVKEFKKITRIPRR